jgi:hypothetical protein
MCVGPAGAANAADAPCFPRDLW